MPRYRVFGNMVLTFMTKVSSGYWDLVDPQNGYTAISRTALEAISWIASRERYDFENDLLIWLNIANVRADRRSDSRDIRRGGLEHPPSQGHSAIPVTC